MFVVEAPVLEVSVPSTPVDEEMRGKGGAGQGSGRASLRSEGSEEKERGEVGVVK